MIFRVRINNKRISQGTLASLSGCVITPTTDLTTLVETCFVGFFFFLL